MSLISLKYLNSSCFDTEVSDAEFQGHIIKGAFVLANYVGTYWISHLKKSQLSYSLARIQLVAETLSISRQNPLFSAFSPLENEIADFRFVGAFSHDAATASRFYKMRRQDLCFSDGK